ncbi:MAG: hypothetical protein P9L88_05030 [Candidatus Tantalella remota]|nr:hypothetical protein [Candidatus Tantalella remota]
MYKVIFTLVLCVVALGVAPLAQAQQDEEDGMNSDYYMTDDGGTLENLGGGQFLGSDGKITQVEDLGGGESMTDSGDIIEDLGDGEYMSGQGETLREESD